MLPREFNIKAKELKIPGFTRTCSKVCMTCDFLIPNNWGYKCAKFPELFVPLTSLTIVWEFTCPKWTNTELPNGGPAPISGI